jgi:hypothetical protein
VGDAAVRCVFCAVIFPTSGCELLPTGLTSGHRHALTLRRNDAATLIMEKKKDAAAPNAPRMADMVRHCHRMAAVRGGGHMRRYVTTHDRSPW